MQLILKIDVQRGLVLWNFNYNSSYRKFRSNHITLVLKTYTMLDTLPLFR